jgi:hypothetical protein
LFELSPYEQIYATDLIYVPGCWQLCGDAHCCSFSRYKARFKLIARTPFQELPLLPGEYEYLQGKGWLRHFGEYEHRVVEYPLGRRVVRVEAIVSRRLNCACDHATRPTICRLYPFLPIFDIHGAITGVEPIGIFEIMEELDGAQVACRVNSIAPEELRKLLTIARVIGGSPRLLYYVCAYRLAKQHVRDRLVELRGESDTSAFKVFENALLRNRLLAHDRLGGALSQLAERFDERYGSAFHLP